MLRATPPGEDGLESPRAAAGEIVELENDAQDDAENDGYQDQDEDGDQEKPTDAEFLEMVRDADAQALQYIQQVNRKSWERGYRALHQEHFDGSKYKSDDFKNRSRLFIPKTRTAVRKDMAAVAASLFGSRDAIATLPGNESDPRQRASAAIIQELVSYRTDRKSSKASIPWFHVAMGARQTALVTGICLSKQSWKLELKRAEPENYRDNPDDKSEPEKVRDVYKPYIDRPESELIPPENFVIDPAADWRNPCQDAAYLIIKYPMRLDEIKRRQKDPRRPWKVLADSIMKAAGEGSKMQAEAIRRAREQGIDRFDKSQTTNHFDIIWVWESFIRCAGEDWTFLSIDGKHLLTDPEPVEQCYPEQKGERPLALGYGALEAFRIFPMSSVESWQTLQQESNDIRNLALDSLKQNIMPVTKVVRGRNVDLDQLKRRGQGTAIMVSGKDDVTWEKIQSIGGDVEVMTRKLDIEFDDLSGQQNYGTVQDNNNLGKTLGGLKLAAGAANAVQEYDIRIWIETWAEVVLTQIVRLEQYYESDPIVLQLCAERAKLLIKHGIDQIDDELLESDVAVSVNVGLGSGDPQQRLAKFQSATQIALPLLQLDPDFASGKKQIDSDAIMEEVFGGAGYHDGGKRFIKQGTPSGPNPAQDAQVAKLQSEAEKNKALAKKAVLDALSNAASVGINLADMELAKARQVFDLHHDHVEQVGRAQDMGHQHGMAIAGAQNAAKGLNPDGTPIAAPGEEAASAPSQEGGAAQGGASGAPPMPGGEPGMPASMVGGEPGVVAPPDEVGAGANPLDPAALGQHGIPSANAGEQQLADQADSQDNLQRALKKPRRRTVTIAKRGPDGRASAYHIDEDREEPAPAARAPQPATKPEAKPAAAPAPTEKPEDRAQTVGQLKEFAGELNGKAAKPDPAGKATSEAAPAAKPARRTDHSKTIMQLKALAAELNKKKVVKRDTSGRITIETDKS